MAYTLTRVRGNDDDVLHCYDIHYINYTLCTVTLVSEFTDSLRQMKPDFLLSSVFPKTHKCTFTTFYFTFSYSSSNSLQFDIYFIRVIFQTHKVMCS